MLYDSHAHLNNEEFTEEERAEFIALADEAVKSGVLSYVNDVGFDLASIQDGSRSRTGLPVVLRC